MDKTANEPNKPDYDALKKEIAVLAKLEPLQYEQAREEKARALKIRASVLDKEVAKLRQPVEAEQGHDDLTDDVIPWSDEVSGGKLAGAVKHLFDKHLVLPSGASTALTLWVMASYAIDSFRIFPKVLISSPEKRCGKTTTLEVINAIAYRSLPASNISAAVLFRAIEAWKPTLLIDEADTFIHGKDELTGVINSGHTKSGAFVLRVEEVDGERVPVKFSTWTPMILAMIKKPPSTIIDRSIVIELQRKKPEQTIERIPFDLDSQCKKARSKLMRWATDNAGELKTLRPEVPQLNSDRAMDNWRPLLAVADLIGWSDKARAAILKLSDVADDDIAIETELLIDIREIVSGRNKIFSADLVDALTADEDRPWSEWKHGKPMTANTLARLLKPYKIKTKQVRIGQKSRKGYELSQFVDAFARYIPETNETTKQVPSDKAFSDSANETSGNDVSFANGLKPASDKGCFDVSFQGKGFDEVINL